MLAPTRFFQGLLPLSANTDVALYTVPQGQTAVIESIAVTPYSNYNSNLTLYVSSDGTNVTSSVVTALWFAAYHSSVQTNSNGMIVMHSGNVLMGRRLNGDPLNAPVSLAVSGYLAPSALITGAVPRRLGQSVASTDGTSASLCVGGPNGTIVKCVNVGSQLDPRVNSPSIKWRIRHESFFITSRQDAFVAGANIQYELSVFLPPGETLYADAGSGTPLQFSAHGWLL